jgi:hypothetical protein
MQELTDLMREFIEYYFTQIHTSFPGVVTEYDAEKRRATVQPSLKRHAGNKEYIALPLLIDVPVQYPGTKKWTIHFPLEKGDEVAIYFSERAIESWKDVGQDGIEDPDPRRFDLCDAYCVPGLQPQEFIAAEEPGLQIIHKDAFDGELISQVLMTDDKVEVKYKKKSAHTIDDDHINGKTEKCAIDMKGDQLTANTEKCKVDLKGDVAQLANSKSTFKLNSGKFSFNNGSKSLFTIWDTLLQSIGTTSPTTLGSPAAHSWNPAIAQAITTAKTDLGQMMEA